jgi:sugar/nucleoside kinase (ribokinase family)
VAHDERQAAVVRCSNLSPQPLYSTQPGAIFLERALMDVVCAGILIADIFASPVDSLPAAGELRLVDRYVLSAGGCAANTAACLRRLGRSVRVIGKVGEDLFGDFVLKDLERLGIDASGVARSSSNPTSNTYIVNVKREGRRYLHCIGANSDFCPSDIGLSVLDDARVLYVGGYMVLPAFGPEDLACLFRQAKTRGLITVLDVVIGTGSRASLEDVAPALPYTDLFLPNDDEARILTGREEPTDQAEVLAQLNPNCTVVITLGRRGALARHRGEVMRARAFDVSSIDESGAGDAFAAGFVTGMLANWPLDEILRFASAVGASCTRALGCTEGDLERIAGDESPSLVKVKDARASVKALPIFRVESRATGCDPEDECCASEFYGKAERPMLSRTT